MVHPSQVDNQQKEETDNVLETGTEKLPEEVERYCNSQTFLRAAGLDVDGDLDEREIDFEREDDSAFPQDGSGAFVPAAGGDAAGDALLLDSSFGLPMPSPTSKFNHVARMPLHHHHTQSVLEQQQQQYQPQPESTYSPVEAYRSAFVSNVSAASNSSPYSDRDILCARGGEANQNPGNKHYMEMLRTNSGRHAKATKKEQKQIVARIHDMLTIHEGRRFMRKERKTGRWFVLSEKEVKAKIVQSFYDIAKPPKKAVASSKKTEPRVRIVLSDNAELPRLGKRNAPWAVAQEEEEQQRTDDRKRPPTTDLDSLAPLAVDAGLVWESGAPQAAALQVNQAGLRSPSSAASLGDPQALAEYSAMLFSSPSSSSASPMNHNSNNSLPPNYAEPQDFFSSVVSRNFDNERVEDECVGGGSSNTQLLFDSMVDPNDTSTPIPITQMHNNNVLGGLDPSMFEQAPLNGFPDEEVEDLSDSDGNQQQIE